MNKDSKDPELLPLEGGPAKRARLDDSVDTTRLGQDHRRSLKGQETGLVEAIFGADTEGATGERRPDDLPQNAPLDPDADLKEADQANYGPADAQGAAAAKQATADEQDAADVSVMEARRKGADADAVMDAMERAEEAFNARAAIEGDASASGPFAGVPDGRPSASNGPISAGSNPSSSPEMKRGSPAGINEAFRESVRGKLRDSLQKSIPLAAELHRVGLEAASSRIEQACLDQGTSRTVYVSRVSNARRMAASVPTIDELVRLAKGEPRGPASEAAPADHNVTHSTTGTQGISLKTG
ncbi:hypothetical protein WJX84_011691 [Apatococcus fuscideae]|uniref:Uncharacterized protein n=1 Tax=Apatococcus fuscideae TaxID=2026836 RepID=A0AAW1SYK7_9CHLO